VWWGAAGVALSLLAGHPQQLFFCAPAILIFITSRVVRHSSFRSLQRLIASSVLVVVIGAGIAAVQLLPQAELVENSHRRLMTFEEATFGSLEGDRIWTVLLPDYRRDYGGEAAGWVGATGLLLTIAGVVSLCRRRMLADLACWLAILFSSLLFSIGASTPVYGILLDIWPGLDSFRFPLRFLDPAVLSVSVLGSYGFQALVDGIADRPMRRGVLAILVGLASPPAAGVRPGGRHRRNCLDGTQQGRTAGSYRLDFDGSGLRAGQRLFVHELESPLTRRGISVWTDKRLPRAASRNRTARLGAGGHRSGSANAGRRRGKRCSFDRHTVG